MRGAALACLLLLAGCQKSFDERYADAQKKLDEQAAAIDRELEVKASEAGIGGMPRSSSTGGAGSAQR